MISACPELDATFDAPISGGPRRLLVASISAMGDRCTSGNSYERFIHLGSSHEFGV